MRFEKISTDVSQPGVHACMHAKGWAMIGPRLLEESLPENAS
jgi:hypothetical protein